MKHIKLDHKELSVLLVILKVMKSSTKEALVNQHGENGKYIYKQYKQMIKSLDQSAKKVGRFDEMVSVELSEESVNALNMFITGYLEQTGTDDTNAQLLVSVQEEIS